MSQKTYTLLDFTCAICFAPPGVSCNSYPGWCGAIKAGAHERKAIVNPCGSCRGTGHLVNAFNKFDTCSACLGSRTEEKE